MAERPCPVCKKPAEAAYRPFCSSRCADVDLHRWFAGAYAVPGKEAGDSDEEEAPQKPRDGDWTA